MCTGIRKATCILAWLPLQLHCIGPEYQCHIFLEEKWVSRILIYKRHVLGKGRIAMPSIGKTCSSTGGRSTRSDTNLRENKQNWSLLRICSGYSSWRCGHEWDTMLAFSPIKAFFSPISKSHATLVTYKDGCPCQCTLRIVIDHILLIDTHACL